MLKRNQGPIITFDTIPSHYIEMARAHSRLIISPVFIVQDLKDNKTRLTLAETPFRHYYCYPLAVLLRGILFSYVEWLDQYKVAEVNPLNEDIKYEYESQD